MYSTALVWRHSRVIDNPAVATRAVHVVAEDPEEYATAVVSFYGRGRLLICEGS